MQPHVIYEEPGFAVVDKPAGLLVHSTTREHGTPNIEPTLVDWLLKKYPEIRTVGDDPATRPGIVHRLDRDTSGVILVPRTQESFEYFKSLFQKREIKKTYLAVVYGTPSKKEGIIESDISLKSGTTKRTVHGGKMTKPAITKYKVLKSVMYHVSGTVPNTEHGSGVGVMSPMSLLEVTPLTGRTHQIRVHLASIGHPIVGDALYGKRGTRNEGLGTRLMLHALSLEFTTREGKRLKIEAEPLEEFQL